MLKNNSKLVNAVSILNRLDPSKISIIVERVLTNNTNNLSVLFQEREIEKMLKVFGISTQDLLSLVHALHFLFMQAAFERNFKPVEASLKAHNIKSELLTCLQVIWTQSGGDYVNKIKDKPVSIEKQLTGVSWNLIVPYKESTLPIVQKIDLIAVEGKPSLTSENLYSDDARNPLAMINFEITRHAQQQQSSDDSQKNKADVFSVEMGKRDIQNFFEQLEIIQTQLDDLL